MAFFLTLVFLTALKFTYAYFGSKAHINADMPIFGVGGPFPLTPAESIYVANRTESRMFDLGYNPEEMRGRASFITSFT